MSSSSSVYCRVPNTVAEARQKSAIAEREAIRNLSNKKIESRSSLQPDAASKSVKVQNKNMFSRAKKNISVHETVNKKEESCLREIAQDEKILPGLKSDAAKESDFEIEKLAQSLLQANSEKKLKAHQREGILHSTVQLLGQENNELEEVESILPEESGNEEIVMGRKIKEEIPEPQHDYSAMNIQKQPMEKQDTLLGKLLTIWSG